jgi:hypothetical protein
MPRRMLSLATALALLTAVAVPGASAFAAAPVGGNGASAPGQANASENCRENVARQTANGQIGTETGSDHDKKQAQTAVTNCDHAWAPGDVGPV